MPSKPDHISVCICTYKRPQLLAKLLTQLRNQTTNGLFAYSIIVVDNDCTGSAKTVVQSWTSTSSISITYCNEPRQNIALARNRAIENARGEFIAFIDDDEFPEVNWLLNLYRAHRAQNAHGVLGPVLPYYEIEPPQWIIKGKFYQRPSHESGSALHWTNTRTGNVLFKRELFTDKQNRFRPEFGGGGEDRDLFKRMIARGYRFVWCAEAPVYELVTAARCKRSVMLKRALLRGKIPQYGPLGLVKSLIAVPVYTSALPILFLLGHHRFMKCLIKTADHVGKLLAFCRIDVIKQKYITD